MKQFEKRLRRLEQRTAQSADIDYRQVLFDRLEAMHQRMVAAGTVITDDPAPALQRFRELRAKYATV